VIVLKCGAFFLAMAPSLCVAAPAPIFGHWYTENERGIVQIAACGSGVCGTIVARGPGTPKDAPTNDSRNDNPAQRARPLIGLRILTDARGDGDDWRGQIYSPDDGRFFNVTLRAEPVGTLKVRGCWGIICRTQHWKPAK
jgi:uncharacterized protein (DUF2147 family)